ncbi:MAG: PDZ domain-containing protein [Moraxellaceae bacterium]|nr:PDZ domain-containing protein [Pseudobdellovibrionaceae bacterium]
MQNMLAVIVVVGCFQFEAVQAQMFDFNKSLDCNWVDPIQSAFLSNHLIYKEKDAELQKRVTEQFLKHLDPAKIYLLDSDVDGIKSKMKNVFELVAKKDCKFATESQELLIKRVGERTEYVKKALGKDFKFNKETEFAYDPDKKTFPKSEKEANEFLDKYLQFQVANYIATEMKLDEAKGRVIKNYERNFKRLKETKPDDLIAGYLNAFALSLDPHSTFFSKDYYEDFNIDMKLTLEGIGATLSQDDGFTTIESLVTGGAAAKSGVLEPKDKIVAVSKKDGKMENVIDMDLKDVVKLIRGPKGTKVKLSVLRKEAGANKKFDVELTREKISLDDNAITIYYEDKVINGEKKKVGIINFPSFYADSNRGGRSSAADLKKIIAEARAKKVNGIVIDLSSNGGGSLDDAVKIGGLFIKTGNIVKQSAMKKSESALADDDKMVDWNGPLVILTSRVSASASEILSGAMKDYNRAVIVGSDHTYGKGSIQTVMPIPGELGALKITIGMFFTPGGYSTQHRGVEADVHIPSPYELDEIGEKSMDYSLPPKKIESFLSKEAYVESGEDKWLQLKSDWIKTIKTRSEERVSKNEEFKKISDELEKTKKLGKIIRVSDILKEKGEKEKKVKKTKYADKSTKEKEYLKRADIQEATNVLQDLILLEEGKVKDLPKVTQNSK